MAVSTAPPNMPEQGAVLHALRFQLSAQGDKFLCAFSGGLDSSVLLHALAKLPDIRVRAIHIHHGLHPDADQWAEHCAEFCRALNIELRVIPVTVDKTLGNGTEAAARHARYAAIAQQIEEHEILLTAHHQHDQAETVLLRLLRGSGSQGLAAMRPMTLAHGFKQYRPLLSVSREALQAYAEAEKLSWIEDPSNSKTDFDRNYLRHEILPRLENRWPQTMANFFRSAELLADEHQCLQEQSGIFLSQLQGIDPCAVSVSSLMQHSKAWRSQILRTWTQSLGTPPLPGHVLMQIEHSLLSARPDAKALVQWSGMEIRRWRDCLYLSAIQPEMPHDWQLNWNGLDELIMPNGDRWGFVGTGDRPITGIDIQNHFGGNFVVTLRRGGEKIQLENREHSSLIKNCLQELGVPPWERRQLPLICMASGECLAMGDVLISARFEAFCAAHKIRFSRKV